MYTFAAPRDLERYIPHALTHTHTHHRSVRAYTTQSHLASSRKISRISHKVVSRSRAYLLVLGDDDGVALALGIGAAHLALQHLLDLDELGLEPLLLLVATADGRAQLLHLVAVLVRILLRLCSHREHTSTWHTGTRSIIIIIIIIIVVDVVIVVVMLPLRCCSESAHVALFATRSAVASNARARKSKKRVYASAV